MVRTCLRNDGPGWVLVGVLGSPFKSKRRLEDTFIKLQPFIFYNSKQERFLAICDTVTLFLYLQKVTSHYKHLLKYFTLPDRLCGPDRSKLVC